MLAAFSADASHQEVARIISEIEQIFFASQAEQLPVESIEFYLLNDLGYGDVEEFRDALGCSFVDFLRKLPHVRVWEKPAPEGETATSEDQAAEKKYLFSVSPPESRSAQTFKIKVETSEDLFRTLLLSPFPAKWGIPELEFESQGSEKVVVDSLYNHLARAVTNLEQHAAMSKNAGQDTTALVAAVAELKGALDVDTAFTFEIIDPDGQCEISPLDEGVERKELSEEEKLAALSS
ncbi:unnamed protein product [Amoebophrya sp. A25]|nr:unnamed protein product [Amoebophrya sp. A25]|eukprot:GSA25T00017827001.1